LALLPLPLGHIVYLTTALASARLMAASVRKSMGKFRLEALSLSEGRASAAHPLA
jgi:hypothetical protein